MEEIATGVWLLRGGSRESMNVYFVRDGDGVVQFDAGAKAMTEAVRAAGEELGGVKRLVLGHAHSDHRGTAPYVDAPVHCHPAEVGETESELGRSPYMDFSRLPVPSRWIYPFLFRHWDGGPSKVADVVNEGDAVAGFEAIHFPGHAPGQIGLWRESDRVALVSDVVYLIDSVRRLGRPLPPGEATVPHPLWNQDHEQAKDSVRRLAALDPLLVAPGHAGPLRGEGLRAIVERAAEKY